MPHDDISSRNHQKFAYSQHVEGPTPLAPPPLDFSRSMIEFYGDPIELQLFGTSRLSSRARLTELVTISADETMQKKEESIFQMYVCD